jgi:hypothetical protein
MIPKKPAPDFVPGCKPIFGKDHAQTIKSRLPLLAAVSTDHAA